MAVIHACCCSPNTCDIAADNFNRADNSDINDGAPLLWLGDTSSFVIESNKLKSIAEGTIYCEAVGDTDSVYCGATMSGLVDGSVYGFHLGEHFAEWTVNDVSTNEGMIRFYHTDESDFISTNHTWVGNDFTFQIFQRETEEKVWATVVSANTPPYSPLPPDGNVAGLYAGDADIFFENFAYRNSQSGSCTVSFPWGGCFTGKSCIPV